MESDEVEKPSALVELEDEPSALNSTILNYYKKFGRKRDLEQYFSLSTATGDIRDPTSLFWRRMKSQSDSDSGEKSRESSTEVCRISIKCSYADPGPSIQQDEVIQEKEAKADSASPPIITEEVEDVFNDTKYSINDSVQSDDDHSQKSMDAVLDTSLSKPLSPTSSITSQRKLEWDSLADVGYANESDRKNSGSNLSTLERLALKQQYSNNDSKLDSNLGLPTAQSTPMDPEEPKGKKSSKTTKIYRRDVDLVEVNLPESSNNAGQSINVNLTKHISFNVEKDGEVNVDTSKKGLSVAQNKMSTDSEANLASKADKEIQTSLTKDKSKDKSSSSGEVPKSMQFPVLINLNTFKTRNRKKRVRTAKRRLKVKRRLEANKENVPVQEKSGEPVSEAESFEYMPGHIYNQKNMNRQAKLNQSAGNKSSLESSGVLTTDSSKESKKSFSKDLEKSINLLKGALQKRYNDSNLKERLVKEVVQRLLKSTYKDEESTTDFLSGLSFNSKKIGLGDHTTTSTSDGNNTAEKVQSTRVKKSILRPDKLNSNSIASTSQSAPNLPSVSKSDDPIIPCFSKSLLTSLTESDASSKEKNSSDPSAKTSSEELYQKYLEALKKEQDYKKQLREKEKFLKQKLVRSDSAFNFPAQLDTSSQNRIKNLMKDLTRNNYNDGSGDASKLEVGGSSHVDMRRSIRSLRSHSVFTLASGEGQRKSHAKRGEDSPRKKETKRRETSPKHNASPPRRSGSPKAGPSRKDPPLSPQSIPRSCIAPSSKGCDSSVQVNIKPNKKEESENVRQSKYIEPKGFPKYLMDPTGEIKYICVCNNELAGIPELLDVPVHKSSRLDDKFSGSQDKARVCTRACQSVHDVAHTSSDICSRKTYTKQSYEDSKVRKIFSKCSQTNLQDDETETRINHPRDYYWIHEGIRSTQTEISIDPKIPDPCQSDINTISDTNCAKLICEQYRQKCKSKSSISSEMSRDVNMENLNACLSLSKACGSNTTSLKSQLYPRNSSDIDIVSNCGQHHYRRMEIKNNNKISIEGPKMTAKVNVGTNIDDYGKTPVKMVCQAIETDPVNNTDHGTCWAEDRNKGIQSKKSTIVTPSNSIPVGYAVDTLFSRENLNRNPTKKPFVRSNTDSLILEKCCGPQNDLLDDILNKQRVSTDTMTDDDQNLMTSTYPRDESSRCRPSTQGFSCFPEVSDRSDNLYGVKWMHCKTGCSRATYHGVIEMEKASNNYVKTCQENPDIDSNVGKYRSIGTDCQPFHEHNDKRVTMGKNINLNTGKCTCQQSELCGGKCNQDCQTSNNGGESLNNVNQSNKEEARSVLNQLDRDGDNTIQKDDFRNLSSVKYNCTCKETTDCSKACDKSCTSNEVLSRNRDNLTKPKEDEIKNKNFIKNISDPIKVIGDTTVNQKDTNLLRESENTPETSNDQNDKRFSIPQRQLNKNSETRNANIKISEEITKPTWTLCDDNTTLYKRKCACPSTAKCGGYCARTAKCMRLKTKPVRKNTVVHKTELKMKGNEAKETQSETSEKHNAVIENDRKTLSPFVENAGKAEKHVVIAESVYSEPQGTGIIPSDTMKSCGCLSSSECGGQCGSDSACAIQLDNTKSTDGSALSTAQDIASSSVSKTTGESELVSESTNSKDLIMELIQNITKRYSKTHVERSDRKKCFKDIMKLLTYLLDTDEEFTDADEIGATSGPFVTESKASAVSKRADKTSESPERSKTKTYEKSLKQINQNLVDAFFFVNKLKTFGSDENESTEPYNSSSTKSEKYLSASQKRSSERSTSYGNSKNRSEDTQQTKSSMKCDSPRQRRKAPDPEDKSSTDRSASDRQRSNTQNEQKSTFVHHDSPRNRSLNIEEKGSPGRNSTRERSKGQNSEYISRTENSPRHNSEKQSKSSHDRNSSPTRAHSPDRRESPERNTSRSCNPEPKGSVTRNVSPLRDHSRERKDSSEQHARQYRSGSETTHSNKNIEDNEGGYSSRQRKEEQNRSQDKDKHSSFNINTLRESETNERICDCRANCRLVNCYCESRKVVKDQAVQLDLKRRYTEPYTESSEAPFSTDMPSSDSATYKVLNKIRKECEKYQQKRCKSHHSKKHECSSSTSFGCEQCKKSCHHCPWKMHKCKSCKKVEKKKSIGYNLFIQTSDSILSEESPLQNPCRPLLKNIILKVPRNKKMFGDKVPFKEITCTVQKPPESPRGDAKSRSRSVPTEASVRDYLEQNRPDFIEQCLTRQQCLKVMNDQRADMRATMRSLLSMHVQLDSQSTLNVLSDSDLRQLATELGLHPKTKTVPPKFLSEREMKKHSEKIYKTLPEVQKKKEELKKERIKKTNLLLANIFKKNLQRKALRGDVNISNYNTVVKI